MATQIKYVSGRTPVTPYDELSSDRYEFLGLSEAEPSLGAGNANSVLTLGASNARVWSNNLTLDGLTVNGISNLGPVSNLTLTGGSDGQFIQTDGNGNLTFATISTSSISNGNSNVSIPIANGNVEISVAGNANVAVFSGTGANLKSLIVEGTSNLGPNGNVIITGGSSGEVLTTDGAGNLSWGTVATQDYPDPMPIVIDTGNTLTIRSNYQGLFGTPLVVDGTLVVDGVLVDVSGQGAAGTDTQVTFNDGGDPSGNNGFTFNKTSGNLAVPGGLNVGTFVKLAVYSKSELNDVTGTIGQIAILNNSNPIGMMAFWDGTNNRWSYVHDNSAVV